MVRKPRGVDVQHWLARVLSISGLALLATACATSGSGLSPSMPAAIEADFSWHAEGWMRGTMTATLPNGDVYEGPYFQADHHTKLDDHDLYAARPRQSRQIKRRADALPVHAHRPRGRDGGRRVRAVPVFERKNNPRRACAGISGKTAEADAQPFAGWEANIHRRATRIGSVPRISGQ